MQFWFSFPWWLVILNIFSYASLPFVYLFGEISFQVLCLLLKFCCRWVVEVLSLFWMLIPYWIYAFQIFLSHSVCRLPFYSVDYFLCYMEIFTFDVVTFDYYYLWLCNFFKFWSLFLLSHKRVTITN